MVDNFIVIIRSAGERTEQLCKRLILEQGVSKEQVVIVREAPFSVAMRKSFELGLESGCKYTFCVDADVLFRPGAIMYQIDQFEKQPENVCEIQGLAIDKFFGGPRPAGNHVYRNSLLPEITKRIPNEGVDIRPEYHMLKTMAMDGYPWVGIPYIIGTHDEEQFNFDIYRKCFVHAIKHVHFADLFSAVWKANENDADFKVALRAFADGFQYRDALFINKNQAVYKEGFDKTLFDEKDEIDLSGIDLEAIEKRVLYWEDHPVYLSKFPSKFGLNVVHEPKVENVSILQKLRNKLVEKGMIKFFIFLMAKALFLIGDRMKKISD